MKKIKININQYYRIIKVLNKKEKIINHTIFDYQKIYDDMIPVFLVISERGSKAKTTQAKKLAKDIWDIDNVRTMWVMNTETLLKGEKKSHLIMPKRYLGFNKNMIHEGDYVYDAPPNKARDNWYTKFTPISLAENEKGSRDDYALMIYDEFNVGLTFIRNIQVTLMSNLIATLEDPINKGNSKFKKIIIHGNYKSLNNQFLIALGVTKIVDEVTDVYIDDFLLMRILLPIMDVKEKKQIEKDNKDNWVYLLQKKLGQEKHVYFNENLFDEVNNVNDFMIILQINMLYYIRIGQYYYEMRIVTSGDLGKVIYFVGLDKKPQGNIYCLNKIDIAEGIIFNVNLKKSILRTLQRDKVFFKSAYIRENIINAIRK